MSDREILGWVRGKPIYVIKGAEGESEVEETEEDSEEGTEGEEQEYTPPSKEEWEKVQKALTKANAQAKRQRLAAKGATVEGDDAAQKATEAAEARYKPVAVRSAARAAFMEAGLTDATAEQVKKLLRLIDMDDVEIGDDGEVDGLEDQIADIKDNFPALFAPKDEVTARRRTRIAAAGKNGGARPKTPSEMQAAALFGR